MNKTEIEHVLVKFFDSVVIDEFLEKLNGISKDFYKFPGVYPFFECESAFHPDK